MEKKICKLCDQLNIFKNKNFIFFYIIIIQLFLKEKQLKGKKEYLQFLFTHKKHKGV